MRWFFVGNANTQVTMRLHNEFQWDKGKAIANRKKHGITFEFAEVVLRDEEGDVYHVDERDDDHSEEEDRHTTFGSHPDDRRIVLRITWTHRGSRKHPITRIISARLATKKERKDYAQKISGR